MNCQMNILSLLYDHPRALSIIPHRWIGLALLFGRETLPPSSLRHPSSHPMIPPVRIRPSSPRPSLLPSPPSDSIRDVRRLSRSESIGPTTTAALQRLDRPRRTEATGGVGGQRGSAAVNDFGVVSDENGRRGVRKSKTSVSLRFTTQHYLWIPHVCAY